jgi:hypothetical protein
LNAKKVADSRPSGSSKNLLNDLSNASNKSAQSVTGKVALNSVKTGFSKKNLGGQTGRREVKGAKIGAPKLSNSPNRTQGLSSKSVMKIVNKNLSKIQRCYERALFNDSNLSGRIEYEWEISPSGRVVSASVKRSEMSNDKNLNNCVLNIFKSMKFPRSTNGQSTVSSIGFPFGRL